MKKYIKPSVEIEYAELESNFLIDQSKPSNTQGSQDIFSNRGGFDDDLFDDFASYGSLWDDNDDI